MSEAAWSPCHGASFDLAQNLSSRIAVHSKRSKSVVTAQQEIHEHSRIEAAARATQHQRNGISPTAPWRFVRDPVKLLLRSLCSRCALYALVAINALPRQLYNIWIAQSRLSWGFSCISSALMLRSWWLNYTHKDCHCATADQGIERPRFHCYHHYLLTLKTLHNSRLSRFKMPIRKKADGKIQAWTCAGDYNHLAWTAGRGIPSSCSPSSCSPCWARPINWS